MGFNRAVFNALIERIIKQFYAFAENIGESVEIKVAGDAVQFCTTQNGGYTLSIIPGQQAWVDESWGSQDYWDAWRITPGDSYREVLVEYTGTVDGNRQLPEWLDFGDWEVVEDDDE